MYLYGASGHAKVVFDILESCGVSLSGLFDDDPVVDAFHGQRFLGRYEQQFLDAPMIICIGNNRTRAGIAEKLQVSFGKAIHSGAVISPSATIQEGTVVMQGSIVQAGTSIGKHAIINSGASVDHDCFIGNYAHVAPGAVVSGRVTVGEGALIGSGAVIIPGIKVGKWCKIGAGAVVIRDIPDNCTAVGNPARIIKQTPNL